MNPISVIKSRLAKIVLVVLAAAALAAPWERAAALAGITRIDVMVVYTPAVTAHRGGHAPVQAHILNSLELANMALANSDIPAFFHLVHAAEINYVESSSMSTDLGRLRTTDDGFMDEVHGWRNDHGADLVCLMRRGAANNVAGIAYQLSSTAGRAAFAFSVVSDASSAASLLMAHELGHNFGAAHDPDNTSGGLFADSHGHRFRGTNGTLYRTVMAYSPGSRVAHFSDPAILFMGTPTGNAGPMDPPANNARGMRVMAPVLAGYRSEKHPGPDMTFNGTHLIRDETRLFPDGFWVGNGPGASGSLRCDNSSIETGRGFGVGIGPEANGTLLLIGTAMVSGGGDTAMAVGINSRATLTIAQNGSLAFLPGPGIFRIGVDGTAGVNLTQGAELNTMRAVLAQNPGSSATININGNGAFWNHRSSVDIGAGGVATVNVLNGGMISGVQRLHVGGSLVPVAQTTGLGGLNVTGGGSRVSFDSESPLSYLAIGRRGTGVVTVSDEAVLEVDGSSTNSGHILVGDGAGDGGLLAIRNGGRVSSTHYLRAGIAGRSGETPAASGEIEIEGPGSLLQVASHLHLGVSGQGNLAILGGGRMEVGDNLSLALGPGAEGNVQVEEMDSIVEVTGDLLLGAAPNRIPTGGESSFTISEGGLGRIGGDLVLRHGGLLRLRGDSRLEIGGGLDAGEGTRLLIEITSPEDFGQLQAGGEINAAGLALEIRFQDFTPATTDRFPLFTGSPEALASLAMADLELPASWVMDNGTLVAEGGGPDGLTYAAWASHHGLTGERALPGADPDGDGHSNLAEFAFGTHPLVPTDQLIQAEREGNALVLRWNRPVQAGVTHRLEMSADLGGWAPVDNVPIHVLEAPDRLPPEGYERVMVLLEAEDHPGGTFFRVRSEIGEDLPVEASP